MRVRIKFISLIVILIFSTNVFAVTKVPVKKQAIQKKRDQSKPMQSDKISEEESDSRSRSKDLLAIPVGVIGYGLGHGLQGRYSEVGWIYTAVDLASLVFVAATMGSCNPSDQSCENDKDSARDVGRALLIGSRLVQIADLTYFYSQQSYADHRKKNNFYFAVAPDFKGSLQATWGLSF